MSARGVCSDPDTLNNADADAGADADADADADAGADADADADAAAADSDDDAGVQLLRKIVGEGALGVIEVEERWRGRATALLLLMFLSSSCSVLIDGGTATGT